MSAVSLDQADIVARVALETARARGAQPLTVVVLDAGGHVVVARREDGSGIARFEIAFGKAWGALGMGISTRGLAARAAKMGTFFNALAAVTDGRMVPVPGGVLIRDERESHHRRGGHQRRHLRCRRGLCGRRHRGCGSCRRHRGTLT